MKQRNATARATWVLTVTSSLLIGTGCSNDLSRSRAADLIKEHKEFTATLDEHVPVGNVWWDWRNVNGGTLKTLQDFGILTYRESGQMSGYWSKEYLVALTPHGKELSTAWTATKEKMPSGGAVDTLCWTVFGHGEPCHQPNGIVYLAVLARKKITEVTGITADAGGKESAADFTWEWVPTADANGFPGTVTSGVHKGEAAFQLYDDGWRITKIELL